MPETTRQVAGLLTGQQQPGQVGLLSNLGQPQNMGLLASLANYLSPSNQEWAPWPIRAARSGLAALATPGDAYAGRLPMMDSSGHTSLDVIGRATDLAGLMTLGAGAVPAGSGVTLRSGMGGARSVRDTAEELARMLRGEGFNIGEVTHWGSGAGQSSYFTPTLQNSMGMTRSLKEFRVSDHDVGSLRHSQHIHVRPTDNLSSTMEEMRRIKNSWGERAAEPSRMFGDITSNRDLVSAMAETPRDVGRAWALYKRSGGGGKFEDFGAAFKKLQSIF